MKKKSLLILLSAAAMMLLSCDYFAGIFENPFVGTWQIERGYPDYETVTLSFTETGFSLEEDYGSYTSSWTGSYTYSDHDMQFDYETRNGADYTSTQYYSYSFESDGLSICFTSANEIFTRIE